MSCKVDSMKKARNTVKKEIIDSRLDPVKTLGLRDRSEALCQERHENHGPACDLCQSSQGSKFAWGVEHGNGICMRKDISSLRFTCVVGFPLGQNPNPYLA